jgi:transcriptional regulator with XRE-family HTH domain
MPDADPNKEIGKRLRAFRESLSISRSAFAIALQIGTERLATYEAGRSPLPYFVFKRAAEKFNLNPFWLVSGDGISTLFAPYDDSEFIASLGDRETFLEVYQQQIKNRLENEIVDAEALAKKVLENLERMMQPSFRKKLPPHFIKLVLAYLENLQRISTVYEDMVEDERVRLAPLIEKGKKKS